MSELDETNMVETTDSVKDETIEQTVEEDNEVKVNDLDDEEEKDINDEEAEGEAKEIGEEEEVEKIGEEVREVDEEEIISWNITPTKNGINLKDGFLQLITYFPSNEKHKEFYCESFRKNIMRPDVLSLHIYSMGDLPDDIAENDKVKVSGCEEIPAINEMLEDYNENTGICCLLRPDIYLEGSWTDIVPTLYEKDLIYCLSPREIDMAGHEWVLKGASSILYATYHGCWISKMELFYQYREKLEFGMDKVGNGLRLANIMAENGILPINDRNYGTYHLADKEEETEEIRKEDIDREGMFFVPDYESIKKVDFNSLIRSMNLTDLDIYILKCKILTKYLN